MAFKLSSLLNPASPSPQPTVQTSPNATSNNNHTSLPSIQHASHSTAALSSDFDAAQALTAFATASSYNSSRAPHSQPSSNSPYSSPTTYQGAQTSNNYSSATPVEPTNPSPSVLQQPFSPTLEQYHHKSKSPEEQRRESFASAARNSPPTVLAPIHNYPQQQAPGRDVSQVVPHSVEPSVRKGSLAKLNETTQNHEPDYVRDESAAHEVRALAEVSGLGIDTGDTKSVYTPDDVQGIKERSPEESNPTSPSDQLRFESQAADPVQIKKEPSGSESHSGPGQSPGPDMPRNSLDKADMDEETRKAIEKLRNDDLGLRRARERNNDKIAESIENAMPPTPTAATAAPTTTTTFKKRPAPRTTAANKKGMAKKPPAKKRKTLHERNVVDGAEKDGSPNGVKPKITGRAKSGTKSKSTTPAPAGSSPTGQIFDDEEDDEEEGSDSSQVYCICRKPDDHRWMIACDGCEDWFHGDCVQMTSSDGELIAKYFCPSCSEAGKGRTLWKPQCRRKGCGKVAGLEANSKYCSHDCGQLFFEEHINQTRREQRAGEKGSEYAERWRAKEAEIRERRKLNRTDNHRNPLDSDSEDEARPGARGGVIRPGELKALVNSVRTVEEFHALGEQLRSPPPSSSPENKTTGPSAKEAPLIPSEIEQIKMIEEEKEKVRVRRALLKDREKFVAMTKAAVTTHAEREGVKPKDFCGYDSRHAWSEGEFQAWRDSKAGKRAFRIGSLDFAAKTPELNANADTDIELRKESPAQEKMEMDSEDDIWKGSMCLKKRCIRHKDWAKTARDDVLFEIRDCGDKMRELDAEEKRIQERALTRFRKERVPDGLGIRENGVVEAV